MARDIYEAESTLHTIRRVVEFVYDSRSVTPVAHQRADAVRVISRNIARIQSTRIGRR